MNYACIRRTISGRKDHKAYDVQDAYGLINAMSPSPSHLPQDRSAYIPPRIQQEMAKHMQQTLPANLQYYQKSGGYVPPQIQKEMAQHLQSTMPEHLKEYINPYMQQTVASGHQSAMGSVGRESSSQISAAAFIPSRKLGPNFSVHTFPQPQPGAQPEPQPQSQQLSPQPVQEPTAPVQPVNPYDFITEPSKPAAQKLAIAIPGLAILPRKLTVIVGGMIAAIIILSVLNSVLSTKFDLPPFLAIAQDQQELIHLSSTATQTSSVESTITPALQNFLATTELTVTSSQANLLQYLANNNQKVKTKELSLKVSPTIDTELTNAVAAGNYTQTFQQVMTSQLNTYVADLRSAYRTTSGKKGHAQLSSDFTQAVLLVKQLDQASGTASD